MPTVPFPGPQARTPANPDRIRHEFGQAAYRGDLPKGLWIEAQGLVARYDDAATQEVRVALSRAMTQMLQTGQTASYTPRTAA